MPQLDRIVTDPIISTENAAFSPSSASPPVEYFPLPSELDPLLGAVKPKKPFYRARPLWLVPFALTSSITRGMTLASRVEVFTELSCLQVHGGQDGTFPDTRSIRLPIPTSWVDAGSDVTLLSLPPVHPFGESKGDGKSEGDDPRVIPGKKCVSDPAVQAGAVRIQTIMTTIMGTLSALTTGWWGKFSERHGRTRVLAISTFGLFLTDLIFILVSTPNNLLATHSHKLLILAPITEGLLGGWSTLTGANTSYIADCTSPGSRATIFARFTGVLFVGLALGPIIGAWLIRNPIPFLKVVQADHPLQSVNSVFWVAILGSFINLLLVLFVFPESLPASRRAMNRKGKNRAIEGNETRTSNKKRSWMAIRFVKSFISPLSVFLPANVPVARSTRISDQLLTRKDWSLTYFALSQFIYGLAAGIFQVKYLYAEHVYHWAAEQLSYYISFMGAVRATFLLVLLPFLLVTFKPAREAVSSTTQHNAKPKPTKKHLFSEIRFDLLVIRCSMFAEFCSHTLVVLFPLPSNDVASAWRSQILFVAATSLGCAGAGVLPAAQSLALSTLQGRKLAEQENERLQGGTERASADQDVAPPDSGRLFGAIAVLSAASQTILAPIIFAMIYSNTVATFPRAVFATAAGLVMGGIALTAFIRPHVSLSMPKNGRRKMKSGVGTKNRAEETRGRSRASKDLRGGTSYGATRRETSVSSATTEAGTSRHI